MRKDKSGVVLRGPSWPPAWDEEAGEVKSGRQTTATPKALCIAPVSCPHSAPSTRSRGPLVLRKPAIDAPTVPAYRAQSHGAPRSGPKGNVRMGGVGGWEALISVSIFTPGLLGSPA